MRRIDRPDRVILCYRRCEPAHRDLRGPLLTKICEDPWTTQCTAALLQILCLLADSCSLSFRQGLGKVRQRGAFCV